MSVKDSGLRKEVLFREIECVVVMMMMMMMELSPQYVILPMAFIFAAWTVHDPELLFWAIDLPPHFQSQQNDLVVDITGSPA